MRAKIISIKPAPYGQYDTEVLALVETGELSESVLRGIDLPKDLLPGQTRDVEVYRGLISLIK